MEGTFRLLIVTGMSGAGKTQVMQALEDMGFFCVDNLPPVLIPKFSNLCRQASDRINQVALVVDIRGGQFFESLSDALASLKEMQVPYEIVFMDATDETLIRRYKESRRSHPLAPDGRITVGLKKERKILDSIRPFVDYIIDTTNMKTSQLKAYLRQKFSQLEEKKQGIAVMFVSSEMPEVLGIADRVIVMCDGKITGEVMAKETSQNEVLKFATEFEKKQQVS